MNILDWKERPFVAVEKMEYYSARDQRTAQQYGPLIKAAAISNRDYKYRYEKFSSSRVMQPPPSSNMHIYLGFLVVRKLGTPKQYETWMPCQVFEELYCGNAEH